MLKLRAIVLILHKEQMKSFQWFVLDLRCHHILILIKQFCQIQRNCKQFKAMGGLAILTKVGEAKCVKGKIMRVDVRV